MAKRSGHRRKQGVVSWLTSIIAILLGLGPALQQVWALVAGRGSLPDVANELNALYNPLAGHQDRLMVGYGSLAGGIIFKAATSELARRARVNTLLPAAHA